jgi:outer membrane protein OmpA-like peptidoglycan-associated protein
VSFAVVHKNKANKESNSISSVTAKSSSHRNNKLTRGSQDSVFHLQRALGNQAVQRLDPSSSNEAGFDFAKIGIQPKLKVSHPNDPYEREADRVAEEVVKSIPSASNPVVHTGAAKTKRIDRKCATCEMNDKEMKKEKDVDGELVISRKSSALPNLETSDHAKDEIDSIRSSSSGLSLEGGTKEIMESRFGYDFSSVRIHLDERAASSARTLNALAYTIGHDIVFAKGRYQPATSDGKRLLAHELTHVIQQRAANSIQSIRKPVQQLQNEASSTNTASVEAHEVVAGSESVHRHSDQLMIQREADISEAPSGLDCVLVSGAGPASGIDLLFPISASTITTAQRATIESFARSWLAGTSRDDVIIDGYASTDGPQALNWRLSCDRANAIKSELISFGIPAGKITTFANGESTAFSSSSLSPNRRAVISTLSRPTPLPPTPTPAPTPPTPAPSPGITFIPCTAPFLIGSRGACGTGADFAFHDFPSTTTWQDVRLALSRRYPDWVNESKMKAELNLLAGSEGTDAFTHFASGTGTTRTHGTSSTLSTLAAGSGTFASALRTARSEINRQISSQAAGGTIDCSMLNIPSSSMPAIGFGFSDGSTLKAVIGGTQGLQVHVLGMTVNTSTRSYDMQLQFTICDDFGVDTSDLYSPGLRGFWVLQHERSGYRPFINEIIVEPTFSGTF